MSNITITDTDVGTPVLGEGKFLDATVSFAAADTFAAGTLMGQKTTSADSYDGTITGTGTREATLTARSGKSMKVGSYTLTAGTLTSGAGEWTMEDPDGITETYTTSAAGEDMTFELLGVDVEIADTGTDYETSDSVAFTVAAGSKWVPFAPTETNGAQDPRSVLTYELTKTSSGDLAARLMVGGDAKKERLIIDEDGDNSNVTAAILAKLRTNGVNAVATEQLGAYDNS